MSGLSFCEKLKKKQKKTKKKQEGHYGPVMLTWVS